MQTRNSRKGIAPKRYAGFSIKVVEDYGLVVKALIVPHNVLITLPQSALSDTCHTGRNQAA